jgi:hypothetical protein
VPEILNRREFTMKTRPASAKSNPGSRRFLARFAGSKLMSTGFVYHENRASATYVYREHRGSPEGRMQLRDNAQRL